MTHPWPPNASCCPLKSFQTRLTPPLPLAFYGYRLISIFSNFILIELYSTLWFSSDYLLSIIVLRFDRVYSVSSLVSVLLRNVSLRGSSAGGAPLTVLGVGVSQGLPVSTALLRAFLYMSPWSLLSCARMHSVVERLGRMEDVNFQTIVQIRTSLHSSSIREFKLHQLYANIRCG